MPYCLPLEARSNIKERSDAILDLADHSSLICIQYFHVILELILKLIHYCKQISDKSNLCVPKNFSYDLV